LVLYIVIVGINGSHLHLAVSEAAKAATHVNASGVLGYGASLIGFTVSYTSLASDFVSLHRKLQRSRLNQVFPKTSSMPAHTPRYILFPVVYLGLFLPIILIQILGAASQLAAFAIPDWAEASLIGTPNLLFAMTGGGGAAKFVMVLFCFSVTANTAPTIYSCGLSGQVAIPWLIRGEFSPAYSMLCEPTVSDLSHS
jgi:purine-cytosine permease-like protein